MCAVEDVPLLNLRCRHLLESTHYSGTVMTSRKCASNNPAAISDSGVHLAFRHALLSQSAYSLHYESWRFCVNARYVLDSCALKDW